MKYLGIKLSEDIDKITALNLNPLLQKIKTNLHKWGKLKLTLWGKINVIKMIVAPQFSYVAMMLPIKIPSTTFRQLDDAMKYCLWGGKRPRIKLRKLCAHKEEGGLGLPDLRLYYLAFEMTKIARYWQTAENEAAWMEVEKEICRPFQPLEVLSQKRSHITNPILLHSKDIWIRVHKMFKLTHTLQRYSSLWYNPDVCIGKKPAYWKQWHSNGLNTINDLFEDGVFLSYDKLLQKFNLVGKDNF